MLLLIIHDYIRRRKDREKVLGRKKNAWVQKVSEENGKHIFTGLGTGRYQKHFVNKQQWWTRLSIERTLHVESGTITVRAV